MNSKIQRLIEKIENAPDFGYDDESVALSKALAKMGKKWKWSDDYDHPKVIIYQIGI